MLISFLIFLYKKLNSWRFILGSLFNIKKETRIHGIRTARATRRGAGLAARQRFPAASALGIFDVVVMADTAARRQMIYKC